MNCIICKKPIPHRANETVKRYKAKKTCSQKCGREWTIKNKKGWFNFTYGAVYKPDS